MKLNNAEYWRSRAEEARTVAVQMMDPHELLSRDEARRIAANVAKLYRANWLYHRRFSTIRHFFLHLARCD
jgi:hypothetical protein